MINETDKQILEIIQQDARITNADIARQVNLAPSAVLERVRKLEERGLIRGYSADIDPRQVGFGLTVFVSVRTSDCAKVEGALSAIPEVLEVHDVAGEDCYLLKVRTKDTEELAKLLREKIKPIPNVLGTRTTVVLKPLRKLRRCRWTGSFRKTERKGSNWRSMSEQAGSNLDNRRNLILMIAAFAAVYIIWGSTYLAIKYAIETMPTFLMAGFRFTIAGGILYLWARFSPGYEKPKPVHWRTSLIVGTLLLAGGNGGVVVGEHYISSSLTALLIATTPFCIVLLNWIFLRGQRPNLLVSAGLLLGFVGVLLLLPSGAPVEARQ